MGAVAKYSDKDVRESVRDIPDHPVSSAAFSVRRYEPASGTTSLLTDMACGDWSWKPGRYPADPGRSLTAAEIDALYPNREYRPNAR